MKCSGYGRLPLWQRRRSLYEPASEAYARVDISHCAMSMAQSRQGFASMLIRTIACWKKMRGRSVDLHTYFCFRWSLLFCITSSVHEEVSLCCAIVVHIVSAIESAIWRLCLGVTQQQH